MRFPIMASLLHELNNVVFLKENNRANNNLKIMPKVLSVLSKHTIYDAKFAGLCFQDGDQPMIPKDYGITSQAIRNFTKSGILQNYMLSHCPLNYYPYRSRKYKR
jgi:hypothetical protein